MKICVRTATGTAADAPAQDSAGLKLALAFGLDHIIVTDADPSVGRSLSGQALSRGKTVLVAEAGRSGVVTRRRHRVARRWIAQRARPARHAQTPRRSRSLIRRGSPVRVSASRRTRTASSSRPFARDTRVKQGPGRRSHHRSHWPVDGRRRRADRRSRYFHPRRALDGEGRDARQHRARARETRSVEDARQMTDKLSIDRRDFLAQSGSCAAHLALAATFMPPARAHRGRAPLGVVVAREPFGNLEKVADGVWAMISTPLDRRPHDRLERRHHRRTQRRAGDRGVSTADGAQWLAGKARELTGRWPTHVALTHYHSDHANGVAGYLTDDGSSGRSQHRAHARSRRRAQHAGRCRARRGGQVGDADLATDATTLDLGGRTVRVIPRARPHRQRHLARARRSEHRVLRRSALERDVPELRRRDADEAQRERARAASHPRDTYTSPATARSAHARRLRSVCRDARRSRARGASRIHRRHDRRGRRPSRSRCRRPSANGRCSIRRRRRSISARSRRGSRN